MANKPIYVRIEDELRQQFAEALHATGLEDAQFVKAAIRAFVEHVREHGEIRLPLAIVPKSELHRGPSPPGKLPAPAKQQVGGPSGAKAASGADPSTGSTRFSVNEDAPQKISAPGPRARSTRGIHRVVGREKGKL